MRIPLPGILAALTTTAALVAQPEAFYPLINDLADATTNYPDLMLLGNNVPAPNPPNGSGGGVCHNGVYYFSAGGGQDIRTPILSNLNINDFQISVEFNVAAMPSLRSPVIMGGRLYRWLGIYLDAAGTVGMKHNNSNYAWSTTTLVTGTWYTGAFRYDSGTGNAELYIDGAMVLQVAAGPLNHGSNFDVTTNDFSNGGAFNGCVRNLLVTNSPGTVATVASYGAGCAGSAGPVTLTPSTAPTIGTALFLDVANLDPAAAFAFMAVGFSDTTSLLGPLPFNLSSFGLGSGCELLTSTDVSALFGVSSGSGRFDFQVPLDPGYAGIAFYFQCGSIDPGVTGGLAVSNGVAATIGY